MNLYIVIVMMCNLCINNNININIAIEKAQGQKFEINEWTNIACKVQDPRSQGTRHILMMMRWSTYLVSNLIKVSSPFSQPSIMWSYVSQTPTQLLGPKNTKKTPQKNEKIPRPQRQTYLITQRRAGCLV